MIYKLFTILLIMCWAFTASAAGQQYQANIEIEYLFELGENIELGEDGYILMPHYAAFDHHGNIFVSDRQFQNISMFSRNGDFQKYFGGKGRGPGEFAEISGMDTDSRGHLVVFDRMQFKMARFDIETEDIEEFLIEDMTQFNMMTLQSLSGDFVAGIYKKSNVGSQSEGAVRIYEFGNGTKRSSHFSYFDSMLDPEIPLEKRLGTGIGHKLHKLNDRQLIVGHSVYFGNHYLLDVETDSVTIVDNSAIDAPYYIEYEERVEQDGVPISGMVSTFGGGGNFFYQILYQSMVHGKIETGEWVHIYRKNSPNSVEFVDYIEVFDSDNRLMYHDEISSHVPMEEDLFYRQYLSISNSGRLIVLDRFELRDPSLNLFQITID